MQPTQELVDSIYRDKVLRARQTPPEQKLFAGSDLFEFAKSFNIAGILHQNPGITQEQAEVIFAQRLALRKRMEEAEWKSRQSSLR